MEPDPRAVALLDARMADPLGLPRMLVRAVGWGESGLQFTPPRGDGGEACGLLQVRADLHGYPREQWEGADGGALSIDYLRGRWQHWGVPVAVSPAVWDTLSFAGRVSVLQVFWTAAQGASQAAVRQRAETVLRETEALFPDEAGRSAMVVSDPGIVWKQPAHINGYTVGRTEGVAFEGIVFHTTAGGTTLEGLAAWFALPTTYAAAWFGIDGEGRIGQFVSLLNTAHAHGLTGGIERATARLVHDNYRLGYRDPNAYLIAIELLDGGVPGNHTPAQLEAAAHLAASLWEQQIAPYAADTGATLDRDHILGHFEIDNKDRLFCPSWSEERFTWMIRRIGEYLSPAAPVLPAPVDRTRELLDALTVSRDDWRELSGALEQARAAATMRADHLDGILNSFR